MKKENRGRMQHEAAVGDLKKEFREIGKMDELEGKQEVRYTKGDQLFTLICC